MERDDCIAFRVTSDGMVFFAGMASSRKTVVAKEKINGVSLIKLLHRDCVGEHYRALSQAFASRRCVCVAYKLAPHVDPKQSSRMARIFPVTQCDAIVLDSIIG